ncbi:MAG: LacI family DNA-binding transcriptional regulator, partial [Octadecabacter sp.]|nr:LacI family DNA-binding transcriptional regulator [Octadecabacter sp.]
MKNNEITRRAPTLKTIAGLTGLAVPTVSRALSGALDIKESTRAR